MKSIDSSRVRAFFSPALFFSLVLFLQAGSFARPNLALSRVAKASSISGADMAAANAVDGDISTRWNSLTSDSQWIFVDFGEKDTVDSVYLTWETAAAKDYYIQVWSSDVDTPSYNDDGWTSVAHVTDGTAGEKRSITFARTPARYLRTRCMSRATTYGVSIYEMEVYGNTPVCPIPSIVKQPVNTIGIIGQPVPFRISVLGLNLAYQWQRSNNGGTVWADVSAGSGGTTATYTFTPAAADSGAMFRCNIVSPCGNAASKAVVLSVGKTKPPRTNIALNTIAKSSAIQDAFLPEHAVDGVKSQASRWASAGGDSSWIFVDLGAKYAIDSLAIYWEHSGSTNYSVQTWSSDADTPSYNDNGWATILTDKSLVYQPPPVDMCLSFLHVPVTTARYVKIRCYARLTNYGCSIFELEVYGTAAPVAAAPAIAVERPQSIRVSSASTNGGIVFTVPGCRSFSCEIFSAGGTLVRRLSSLTDAIRWDLSDRLGARVHSGMYLARVTTGGKALQRKIAVCR